MELLEPVYKVLEGIKLTDDKIKELVEDLKSVNKAENNYFTNALHELQKEYDKYEARIERLADDRFDGLITGAFCLKKLSDYSGKQKKILNQIESHDKADKNHYITANTILNLAQRAREIFDSSEVSEKRELLNFLLQNCELKGRKLQYKLKTPFDTVLLAGSCPTVLPAKLTFRTIDWGKIAEELKLFDLYPSKFYNKSVEISSKI